MKDVTAGKPTISIDLGIEIKSKASLRALRKRARKQAEVVAAKQPALAFLTEGDFVETAPLVEVDGMYVIEGPLPNLMQPDFFPQKRLASFMRDDEAEIEVICKTLEAVKVSAALLDEVAEIMATSPRVLQDIRQIENSSNLDTGPARRFVYEKQLSFDVVVDGEPVTFNGHTARTAVTSGEHFKALVVFSRPKDEGELFRGKVDVTWGKKLKNRPGLAVRRDFRFGKLAPWQDALLHIACHLQHPVLVRIVETESTCSLRPLSIDVLEVENWPDLINMGLTELSKAANDPVFGPGKALGKG